MSAGGKRFAAVKLDQDTSSGISKQISKPPPWSISTRSMIVFDKRHWKSANDRAAPHFWAKTYKYKNLSGHCDSSISWISKEKFRLLIVNNIITYPPGFGLGHRRNSILIICNCHFGLKHLILGTCGMPALFGLWRTQRKITGFSSAENGRVNL